MNEGMNEGMNGFEMPSFKSVCLCAWGDAYWRQNASTSWNTYWTPN